jgi:hypothetical protein
MNFSDRSLIVLVNLQGLIIHGWVQTQMHDMQSASGPDRVTDWLSWTRQYESSGFK